MKHFAWKTFFLFCALQSFVFGGEAPTIRFFIEERSDGRLLHLVRELIPRKLLNETLANGRFEPCENVSKPTIVVTKEVVECSARFSAPRLQIAVSGPDRVRLRLAHDSEVTQYDASLGDVKLLQLIFADFRTSSGIHNRSRRSFFVSEHAKEDTRKVAQTEDNTYFALVIGVALVTLIGIVEVLAVVATCSSGRKLERKLADMKKERQDVAERTSRSSERLQRLRGGVSATHLPETENYVGNSYVLRKRQPMKFDQQIPVTPYEFKKAMDQLTKYIVDYLENTTKYPVTTDISPDSLWTKMDKTAPEQATRFEKVMGTVEKFYVPAMTHWQHPRFHAHFVAGCSFPDILAEMLASSLAVVGFTWDSCPALTELEILMVNWVGRALGLPDSFLYTGNNTRDSVGGGSIQPGSTDAVFTALMAARYRKIEQRVPNEKDTEGRRNVFKKLVAYASCEANSSIEKAARLGMVRLKLISCDDKFSLSVKALEEQIKADESEGLIPFFVQSTAGSISMAAFDNLGEIGVVAEKHDMWLHVNGTYGLAAMICPEFRSRAELIGLEKAHSIDMSAHKLFMHSSAHTFLWTRDKKVIQKAFAIDATYLKGAHEDTINLRDWGIPLSRRFLSLKTWFVFRLYGIKNIQAFVRRTIELAGAFRTQLEKDSRIQLIGEHVLGIVCFQLKGETHGKSNELTRDLAAFVNKSRQLAVSSAKVERTTHKDVEDSFNILKSLIDQFVRNL
ncbi:hypothetical protein QR680_016881 [Steinernema hermaphroditum]|uniref:Uncharacterized protein n=1 Tax=Steinernema hermaphroditum TaxID=289476 RepID=A0AA39LN58_9BILA|nr:hypothetical protein QR680_016881 [Steinernema hermaphroditum]